MKDRSRQASLIISSPGQAPREEMIFDEASIGSAAENSLRVEGAGVGRYHLLIEKRGDGFWARELNWTEETTINGAPLAGEQRLTDGDRLKLGGGTEIEFYLLTGPASRYASVSRTVATDYGSAASNTASKTTGASSSASSNGGSFRLMLIIMPVMLVVITVIAVAVSKYVPGPGCSDTVRIISPEDGAVVRSRVLVKVARGSCIEHLVLRLDQQVIPHSDDFWLDPAQLKKQIPDLFDKPRELALIGEDGKGREISSHSVKLKFEQRSFETERVREWLLTFTGNVARGHPFSDDALVEEIARRASLYTVEDVQPVWEQRQAICHAFSDQQFPPEFGVALALSRRRLPSEDGETHSFWRLPKAEVAGKESALEDPLHAAESALAYVRELKRGLPPHKEYDFIYVIACFGLNAEDARLNVGNRLSVMTENYYDFGSTINRLDSVLPPGAADRVKEFLAAGLVAYFPEKFNPSFQSFDDPCGKLLPL